MVGAMQPPGPERRSDAVPGSRASLTAPAEGRPNTSRLSSLQTAEYTPLPTSAMLRSTRRQSLIWWRFLDPSGPPRARCSGFFEERVERRARPPASQPAGARRGGAVRRSPPRRRHCLSACLPAERRAVTADTRSKSRGGVARDAISSPPHRSEGNHMDPPRPTRHAHRKRSTPFQSLRRNRPNDRRPKRLRRQLRTKHRISTTRPKKGVRYVATRSEYPNRVGRCR